MMWRVLAASERGVSHEQSDAPCQDAHAWIELAPDMVICAVADGLGSAPRSEEGSRLAADTAVQAIRAALKESTPSSEDDWRSLLSSAFTRTADALRAKAAEVVETVEAFDTTLIVSVSTSDWTASAHVGDGAVVIWRDDDVVETFSAPEHNEYANIVTPITVPNLINVMRIRVERHRSRGFAMITDGLQPLTINHATDVAYDGFFRPLFNDLRAMPASASEADVEDLRAFLRSPRVNERTTDDKTLLWAVRGA